MKKNSIEITTIQIATLVRKPLTELQTKQLTKLQSKQLTTVAARHASRTNVISSGCTQLKGLKD
jgi:hypothetical protein